MNRQLASHPLAFALLLLFACGRPDELLEEASISGRVYDRETLEGIAGAVVTTEPASSQVKTNAEGHYVLETGLLSGKTYRVSANRAGYRENSGTVRVEEGRDHRMDLALEQSGPLLAASPETVLFGGRHDSRQILLENIGSGPLSYEVAAPAERWLVSMARPRVERTVEALLALGDAERGRDGYRDRGGRACGPGGDDEGPAR